MTKKKLLVDICGTLYRENTTFLFLEHFYSNKFINIRRNIIIKTINKISLLIFKFDVVKYFYLRCLRFVSKEELYANAEILVSQYLNENAHVFDFIKKKRDSGYEIELISATLDPIASAVSKKLGVRFISSVLDYDDGVCTGKLKEDIYLNKIDKVSNYLHSYQILELITDNRTDLPLCVECSHFFAVSYSDNATKFWYKNGAKYVFEI